MAGEDDEVGSSGVEVLDSLMGEGADSFGAAATVGCAELVTEVKVIVMREVFFDCAKDGEAAES